MSANDSAEASSKRLAPSQIITSSLSIVLFLASLTQTAFYVSCRSGGWPAWIGLLFGWLQSLSWGANPALFASWICGLSKKSENITMGAALLSLFLMFSFLLETKVMINENGGYAPIVGYGPGY